MPRRKDKPIETEYNDLDFDLPLLPHNKEEPAPAPLEPLSPVEAVKVKTSGGFEEPEGGLTYDEARGLAVWMLSRARFAMPWDQGSAKLYLPKDWPEYRSGTPDFTWRVHTTLGAWAMHKWIPHETTLLLMGAFKDAARKDIRAHYNLDGAEVPQPYMPSL